MWCFQSLLSIGNIYKEKQMEYVDGEDILQEYQHEI